MKPSNPIQIYDLDNIVTLKDKQILGFVLDLVGHVTTPQYTVRLYPCFVQAIQAKGIEVRNQILDQRVYLV